jgi:acyl dehydratase
MLGAAAISLASAMCGHGLGSAAFVATSKELSPTMAAATKGAPVDKLAVVRPPDDLTARRTKRQKRGYSRSD